MERTPWWTTLEQKSLKTWSGKPKGVKADGGGNIRGQGRVGKMLLWRAVHNKDAERIQELLRRGEDVNEVEGAGNTPLHAAAYQDWVEGIDLLVKSGAKGRVIQSVTLINHSTENDQETRKLCRKEIKSTLIVAVNASNNAGDTPWHTAKYMNHQAAMQALEKHGATKKQGKVLVQEHVPKVKDFYQKDCWRHHPLPYADYVEHKRKEREAWEAARKRAAALAES